MKRIALLPSRIGSGPRPIVVLVRAVETSSSSTTKRVSCAQHTSSRAWQPTLQVRRSAKEEPRRGEVGRRVGAPENRSQGPAHQQSAAHRPPLELVRHVWQTFVRRRNRFLAALSQEFSTRCDEFIEISWPGFGCLLSSSV